MSCAKKYAVCNRKSARHIDHPELHVVYSVLGFRFDVIVSLFSILISLYRREDFIQWIPQMLTCFEFNKDFLSYWVLLSTHSSSYRYKIGKPIDKEPFDLHILKFYSKNDLLSMCDTRPTMGPAFYNIRDTSSTFIMIELE